MISRAPAPGELALALALALALGTAVAAAGTAEEAAQALVERAEVLAGEGRCAEARPLLAQAIAVGKGTAAAQTADLLVAVCAGLDAPAPGAPTPTPTPTSQPVTQPVAERGAPARTTPDRGTVLDPYLGAPTPPPPPAYRPRDRRGVAIASGGAALVGAQLGLAFAAQDDARPEGLAALGGAGAGLALGLVATWDRRPVAGSAAAAASVLQWSVAGGAIAGWVAADASEDDAREEAAAGRGAIAGGAVGAVLGLVTLERARPTEGTVAAIDALGLGGCASGFLVAGVLAPARDGAYGLQCGIGAGAGLLLGGWIAPAWDAQPGRVGLVVLGSAAGAATSLIVYPLIRDDGSRTDERALAGLALAGMMTGAVYAWIWTIDPEAEGQASEHALRPGLTVVRGVRDRVPGLMLSGSLW